MADNSAIEWTDATWNPIVGCSLVSPACTNCYAMAMAARIEKMSPSSHYAGTTRVVNGNPVWTGLVRAAPDEILTRPLRWKSPRRIFVNSMSDLFHEGVSDERIDRIFAVMALAPRHTFQVLTKRPKRMREYFNTYARFARILEARIGLPNFDHSLPERWPLPNVWLGVTAEDQQRADERIPDLLATPAAARFVSCEPLLGSLDLAKLRGSYGGKEARHVDMIVDALSGKASPAWNGRDTHLREKRLPRLDQVIAGGESGPGARPSHPDWFRGLRDECAQADVPFFFKQNGEWAPTSSVDVYCHGPNRNERLYPNSEGVAMLADGRVCLRDFSVAEHNRRMATGIARDTRAIEVDKTAIAEFIGQIRLEGGARENPLGLQWMYRVGKARAGRLLDGREHNGLREGGR